MIAKALRWVWIPFVVGTGLAATNCTDKRHDCTWQANCAGGGGDGGANGGQSPMGGKDSGGMNGEGASAGRLSSDAGTAGTLGSAGAAGNAITAASGASAAGATGAAGGQNMAGTAGTAGSPDVICDGNPNVGDCAIDPKFGVFVSPLGDDSLGNGTPASPLKTLQTGLRLAKLNRMKAPLHVYLCADTAAKFELSDVLVLNAELADGVSIFGGFACTNSDGWKYNVDLKSQFVATTPTAFRVEGIQNGLHIENVSVTAADAPTASNGVSSIAVLAVDSPALELLRVELQAGNASAGAAGENYLETRSTAGTDGNIGTDECSATVADGVLPNILGGLEVVKTCTSGDTTVGGKGGFGAFGKDDSAGSGNSGAPIPNPNPDDFGIGGIGEISNGCVVGHQGKDGEPGAPVAGASGPGQLSASLGFVPTDGKDGNFGKPGQGGGGGGGRKAPSSTCGVDSNNQVRPLTGASGGSGGTGGCGGKGGKGGKGGGASIALALINSPIKLTNTKLIAKSGGAGGRGGAAQEGGLGGSPGRGGKPACAGGFGGYGGNGSPGSGGSGGPSIALAYAGRAPTESTNSYLIAQDSAPGGADGKGSTASIGAGASGSLVNVAALDAK